MANYEITAEQRKFVRSEFERVLASAVPAERLSEMGLFDPEADRWIARQVQRKLFEPQVPNGGEREELTVERLTAVARDRQRYVERLRKMAYLAVEAWRRVLPPTGVRGASGFYYVRRPLAASSKQKTGGGGPTDYDFLNELKQSADPEVKWAAQFLLEGPPVIVADFRMDPLFSLVDVDGEVSRMVQLRNVSGETRGPVPLNADGFHSSQEFRRWCLQHGHFDWKGNQTEIDALHEDVARQLQYTDVIQVPVIGWHPLKEGDKRKEPDRDGTLRGLWLFGDGCWLDGKLLEPDRRGIYWVEGVGYQLSDRPREGHYGHGKPLLRPKERLADFPLELTERGDGSERDLLRGLFLELNRRLVGVVGGNDARIILGSFFAYAAAPEVYAWRTCFPGIWMHGQRGSGKSTIARDLMRIWGFDVDVGLELKQRSVTPTGMAILLDQYSNLPVWADEYRRHEVEEEKIGPLHAAFNRGQGFKWTPQGGVQRSTRTVWVVSGESTTGDSGLRNRYPHVHITARHREELAKSGVNHLEWFLKHRAYFHHFGRYLIEHREEFVRVMLPLLRGFMNAPDVSDDRLKFVGGVSYAAWMAVNAMLEGFDAQVQKEFRSHCLAALRVGVEESEEDLNINRFWSDLIVAVKAGDIRLDNFRVETVQKSEQEWQAEGHMALSEQRWTSRRLFIYPGPVLAELAAHMAKRREEPTLSRKDLQAQLSVQPYWLAGPHVKKLGGASVKMWGIDLDRHPLGYRACTDLEYERYKADDATMDSTADPRKGDLFVIVNKVLAEDQPK